MAASSSEATDAAQPRIWLVSDMHTDHRANMAWLTVSDNALCSVVNERLLASTLQTRACIFRLTRSIEVFEHISEATVNTLLLKQETSYGFETQTEA